MRNLNLEVLSDRVLDRRRFLGASAITAAGLLVPFGTKAFAASTRVTLVPAGQWSFLMELVEEFAGEVAYNFVGNAISDWARSLTNVQRQAVAACHQDFTGRGYIDPAQGHTPIYGNEGSTHCVYYPVKYDEPKQVDGAAPFYDFCSCTCRAVLAAPTLFALKEGAKALRASGNSPEVLSQCLVPDKQQSASYGRFSQPYNTPDVYTSENGTRVGVSYNSDGREGAVRLVAVRDNTTGTQTLIDQTYNVTLTA